MRIGKIEVKVLKEEKKLKEEEPFNLKTFDLSWLVDLPQKDWRSFLSRFFCQTQKEKAGLIVFLAIGLSDHLYSKLISKITAQELFRRVRSQEEFCLEKVIFITGAGLNYEVFSRNVVGYLNHLKNNKGPFLTVDGLVLYQGGLVLIRRTNPPLGWALPGGFVDYGEEVEQAVAREIKEETNLDFEAIKQFKVYSRINRDPRFHTVSVVFSGRGKGVLRADSDAKDAAVFKVEDKASLCGLPEDIAFDHREIIRDFFNQI